MPKVLEIRFEDDGSVNASAHLQVDRELFLADGTPAGRKQRHRYVIDVEAGMPEGMADDVKDAVDVALSQARTGRTVYRPE